MAGHSKWANIKHKKAKEDAARGKAFTKLIKEITVCAKESGGDPAGNPRLRTLLEKARHINMPQDNIKRAIQKGTGELPGSHYEAIRYEGYGPSGIAVIIEVLTDNKNRAIADLRHAFSRNGGNIAETGAVSWMFEKKGVVKATGSKLSEDELLEMLIDYDIDGIEKQDELFVITCAIPALEDVKKVTLDAGLTIDAAEVEWVAKTKVDITEAEEEKVFDFLSAIEDLDDVQNLYSNLG